MPAITCGFPDESVAQQSPSAFDSYIGGTPTSFFSPEFYSFSQPKCPNCEESISFLMQLYCPVDSNHRALYFFSCSNQSCQASGSFCRVYRLTAEVSEPRSGANEKMFDLTLAASEWNLDSDSDNGMESGLNLEGKDPLDGMMSNGPIESHAVNHLAGPFKCYFINVYDDEIQGSPRSSNLSSWVLDYQAEAEFVEEDEKFAGIITTPYYQQHLATRDSSYGLEPIRYSWEGKPIFTSASPSVDWEPHLFCPRCRGCRVFEVQIFPTINDYLHPKKTECVDKNNDFFNPLWPLNFSTLIVFSCKANCRSTSGEWMEECVLVQNDEGGSFFVSGN
ncbi:hypothetical protein Aperf_G00000040924 [Anoplocephala perfoliata]